MPIDLRIPFGEAILEPRLLKAFVYGTAERGFEDGLGFNQRAMLKAIYGLVPDEKEKDRWGWTEGDYLAADLGYAEFDDLGFIRKILPHPLISLHEVKEAWIVAGRRSGKSTSVAAVIVAYEAALGGHEAYKRRGRPAYCYQIAQDTRMAKSSLRSLNTVLESMDFIYNKGSKKNKILQVVADRIDLWNEVTIMSLPPTVKSVRGYDCPVAVLDEVGVWYQDSDSANPDKEIYKAITPSQAQFPFAKLVGISSPWNRGGLLYQNYEAGTHGRNIRCVRCRAEGQVEGCLDCAKLRIPHQHRMVMHTTTAASTNPLITKEWLREELNKDPKGFERECLARFQDSASGFLSAAMLDRAKDVGVVERPPEKRNFYIGAIDPAFKHDSFAFTIVHTDPARGVVQDYVTAWRPETGAPVNPAEVFPAIAAKLREYGMKSVFSDQYTTEVMNYVAQQHGFSIDEVVFTAGSKAEIYANLQQLLNQDRLRLLDHQDTINELKLLEKKLTQGGQVKIGAPSDMHDDLATVIAMAAKEAVWMLPDRPSEKARPLTTIEKHIQQMSARSKARYQMQTNDYDW